MNVFWNVFADMKAAADEALHSQLNNDPEFRKQRDEIDSLLNRLDRITSIAVSDAFTKEATILEDEFFLAGVRAGFQMAQILQSDTTMLELSRERDVC